MSQSNDANPQLMASNPNHRDQPYASNMQILVVGVHGTNNGPDNIANVTRRIGESLDKITTGNVLTDTSFSWKVPNNWMGQDLNWSGNQPWDREKAAGMLTNHVLGMVDEGLRNGTIDRSKPLIITPVGFSHGGNVAMQAADDISEGLKQRGINGGIHMVTLSTPAYNDNRSESNSAASRAVTADGITFEHTHFYPNRDIVAGMALGNGPYINGRTGDTRNYPMAGNSFLNGFDNHGNTQDSQTHIKIIQEKVQNHFHSLAYGSRRAELGEGETVVATAPTTPGTPSATNAPQNEAFQRDPVVQQVYSSLERAMPGTSRDNINPVLVSDLATAVYQQSKGNNTIGEIAFSNDRNTAFIVPGGKSLEDPSTNPMRVNIGQVNERSFEQAWQQTTQAMQQNQNNQTIAAVEPERQQQRSAMSMG